VLEAGNEQMQDTIPYLGAFYSFQKSLSYFQNFKYLFWNAILH